MRLILLLLILSAVSTPVDAQDRAKLIQQEEAAVRKAREEYEKLKADRDTTTGVSDICPVHKAKMRVQRVPIVYGMLSWDPTLDVRKRRFPNALVFYPGGCVETDISPSHAFIYICPDCRRAEKKWRSDHGTK
jgi:hypothetical protein